MRKNLVTIFPLVPIQAGTQIGLIGGILYARMVSHFTAKVESGLWAFWGGEKGRWLRKAI